MKVIIYARTSTSRQNIKEQIASLLKLCNEKEWIIVKIFKDSAKGGLDNNRDGINDLMEYIHNNTVDKLIITEISRLSRDIDYTKELITNITNNKVSIYISDLYNETLLNNNINTNLITILYDEIKYSNIELSKVKSRLERGYKNFINNGGKVGRKKGFKNTDIELLFKHEDIVAYLMNGYSVRIVATICGKSSRTVMKIRKILKNDGSLKDITPIKTKDILEKLIKNDTLKESIKTLM